MKKIVSAFSGTLVGGSLLCFLALAFFSCVETPLAPVAPMSDIKLQGISLIDITKTFADFLSKDTTLTRNSDGTSAYLKSATMSTQGIPDIVLTPQPSTQQVGVGLFSVTAIPTTSSTATVAQMGLSSVDINYPGANPPFIPPFPASYVSRPGDTLNYSSQFDYLAINSGTLSLQFANNLPLPLTFNRPIILRNNQQQPFVDTSVIAVFNVGTIDSFANYNSSASLAGKILRSRMKFDSISFTTQPRSTPFLLKTTDGVSVQFSSSSLIADSASAVIPQQLVKSSVDSVLNVDSLTVVKSAVFKKGVITFRLVNKTAVVLGVFLSVKEMIQDGASYAINQSLAPKDSQDFKLDFTKISIRSDSLRTKGTSVKFSVGISTINSTASKKNITKNDFVKASFIPQDPLVVKFVDGKIPPTVVQVNSAVGSGIKGTDLTNLSAQVAFKGMQITMNILITGGFPTDYHLAFIAKNFQKNKVDSIILDSKLDPVNFPRIYPDGKTITKISFSNQVFNDFLAKFFPDVPDSFYVRGNLTMDPPDVFNQSGTSFQIYDTTKVYPSYALNFPAGLGIKNGVITDVIPFGKDQIPKDFTKSVAQGTLTLYFYNKFPFKMFFHADFMGNYDKSPQGQILFGLSPSDTIQPAAVDVNGLTTAPTYSKTSITLNNAQMVQFNTTDSLAIRISMSTSNNGQVVKVRDSDYIRVYAKGDLTYTFGKQ